MCLQPENTFFMERRCEKERDATAGKNGLFFVSLLAKNTDTSVYLERDTTVSKLNTVKCSTRDLDKAVCVILAALRDEMKFWETGAIDLDSAIRKLKTAGTP